MTNTTAKKAAAAPAKKAEPAADPMANAHPLVGVAETVTGTPRTALEQRKAIENEYGQYVAVQGITHDGALAYNVGDAVPASNVERWDYLALGLVKRVGTKAAAAAQDVAHGEGDPTDPDAPVV